SQGRRITPATISRHEIHRRSQRAVRSRVPHGGPDARRPRRRAAVRDVARGVSRAWASAHGRAGARGPAMAMNVADLDLRGVSDGIARGEFSSVEATEAYLGRIAQHDPVLRSYITVTADLALAQAKDADAEIARSRRRGPLHGVPIALKDLI